MAKYRYGATEASIRSYRTPCPKEGCGNNTCFSLFSYGGYSSCHTCGRIFGWTDARMAPISRNEFESRKERRANRPAHSAGKSCPAEEDEMAKAKKTTKAAKKAGPKAAKGSGVCAFVREYALAHKDASVDVICAELDKKFPGGYSVATVRAQSYRARKGLDQSGRTSSSSEKKAPAPVAKPKASPKAVKKPVVKKPVAEKKEEPQPQ